MKKCYEIQERINRHNERCQGDCIKFVENNIGKYPIEEIEIQLCEYCKSEWRGQKRIWWFLGHSPDI